MMLHTFHLCIYHSTMRNLEDPAETSPERLVGSDRVLAVLIALAERPDGASLDELAKAVDSPKPTVHRALGALTRSRLARKVAAGRYALGDEFLRLAFAHQEARPEHLRAQPVLTELARRFGETAHYAVLVDSQVVYRAKVDPPEGAVRLTSTIGGRNPARTTAVGKLLLAEQMSDDEVRAWANAHPAPRLTENTLVDTDSFVAEVAATRARGYGIDAEENEPGINCLAVPVATPLGVGAVSVSALAYRTPLDSLVARLPEIREIVHTAMGA